MTSTADALKVGVVVDDKTKAGLKSAQKNISSFEKNVKSLGRTLGIAFSAQALANFGKNSVKAFIADEEAANRLSVAVKNLGMGFANPYITDYIKNLEKTSKVADDQLRPAFQALLQQTGSLTKSQSLLNTAIEVSRGSGTDLATVSNDLAQAYIGNTKGLKKYYLGLSNAQLKAKSFSEIQDIISKQFAGSSAAYLSTYSGQVGVLSLAWQNFQENVGGALLTMASFGSGGQSQGLSNLATVLDKIGSAVTLISKGWDSVAKLFNVTGEGGLLSKFNPYGGGGTGTSKPKPNMDKYAALLAKIEAERKKQNDAILRSQKALTAEQKKQAALKKAGTVFDLEQIQLVAALKGQLSDQDKLRAEAQLALLNGNDALATKLTQQILASQDATGELAKLLTTLPNANNPFQYLEGYLANLKKQADSIGTGQGGSVIGNYLAGAGAGNTQVMPQSNAQDYSGFALPTTTPGSAGSAAQFGSSTPWAQAVANSIVVQIDGKEIASVVQNQALNGNTSTINRSTGTFG